VARMEVREMWIRNAGLGRLWRLVRQGTTLLLAGLVARGGWVGGAGLALALPGCRPSAEAVADGGDPLAALAAAAQSVRYDGAFWTREAHRHSRTWRAAKVYCREAHARGLPNCHAVELVERWEGPWFLGAPDARGALPALPALPPPPPLPPALHPGDPGRVAEDIAALAAWQARLTARGQDAAAGGRR
jgi:hypothetical protein